MNWSQKLSFNLPDIKPAAIRGVFHDTFDIEQIRTFIVSRYPHLDEEIILQENSNDKFRLLNLIFPVTRRPKTHNPLQALVKLDDYVSMEKNSQAYLRYKAALITYGIDESQIATLRSHYRRGTGARRYLIIGVVGFVLIAILSLIFRNMHTGQHGRLSDDNESVIPRMIKLSSGKFTMGSPASEAGHEPDETQHDVSILMPFEISETEITQAQFVGIMKVENPSCSVKSPSHPVDTVTWYDAIRFCNALSKQQGLEECYQIYLIGADKKVEWKNYNCNGYRLPTEAEWEYAARAGASSIFAGSENLDAVGWYRDNSGDHSHAVKGKAPNRWGLYDMSGNLAEWVWDGYGSNYQGGKDLSFSSPDLKRVSKGGCFTYEATSCRVPNRSKVQADKFLKGMGFRIARTINEGR